MMPIANYLYWRYVRPLRGEKGATAVEYGIMVALIAAVIIITVGLLGGKVEDAFDKVYQAMTSAPI